MGDIRSLGLVRHSVSLVSNEPTMSQAHGCKSISSD